MTHPYIYGYEFVKVLGSGGFSTVYQYRQTSPERMVAIKVLTDRGAGAQLLKQLAAEANAMARLQNHPHIVAVLGTGVADDGRHYIVMPYCPGPKLVEAAKPAGLDLRRAVQVAVQTARAVQAVHQAGYLHRDIKPANILIDEYDNARLTDFGIAGRLVPQGTPEDLGLSIPWSPPEILDNATATPASDVYSLGATIWHLLVGHSPFQGGPVTRQELEARIRSTPAPQTGREDVPAALEDLLAKMLDKRRGRRPGTVGEVLTQFEAIERALDGPLLADAPWERQSIPAGVRPQTNELAETATPRSQQLPEPELVDKPAGTRAWWIWGIATAVVIGAFAAFLQLGHSASGRAEDVTPTNEVNLGNQDAGGEDLPPGTPFITATRTDAKIVHFTWTYSAPMATDTYSWRTVDGAATGTTTTAWVDLPDRAGDFCLQVRVIRAAGSHATVDWSPKGCAP